MNSTSIAELVIQDFLRLCDGESDREVPSPVRVLVALSGGIDSVSLLSILKEKLPGRFEVFACYVNHKVRLDTAADEAFCQALCTKLAVPLLLEAVDLPVNCAQMGEALLRELRYGCLRHAAEKIQASYVVTAHNFDDQVETVMLRLLRGTSLAGLAAIEERRPLGKGLALLRPLLKVPRLQIEKYLQEKGLGFREDSTNKEMLYKRNFLRLKVVPLLREGFPGWEQAISRFARSGYEDEEYLLQQAEAALPEASLFCREAFLTLAPPLQRRLLARLLAREQIEVNFSRLNLALELISKNPVGKLNLATGKYLLWDGREIKIVEQSSLAENKNLEKSLEFYQEKFPAIKFEPPGSGRARRIFVSWLNQVLLIHPADFSEQLSLEVKAQFPPSMSSKCFLDLSRVCGPLSIRLRRPHDLIQPLGMKNKVKLKRYLQTHQAESGQVLLSSLLPVDNMKRGSALERRLMVVLADQEEVLWVPGIGLSEKVKVTGPEALSLEFLPLAPDEQAESKIQQTC